MTQRTKSQDGRPAAAPAAETDQATEPAGRPPATVYVGQRKGVPKTVIPTIPDNAAKLAAIRERVQRKRRKTQPHEED
jgi:hypothetical protein